MTLEQLLEKLEPSLEAAFLAAIDDWRNSVDYPALTAALSRNDIDAAIEALGISEAAFNEYIQERQRDYLEAGALILALLGARKIFRGLRISYTDMIPFTEFVEYRAASYVAEQNRVIREAIADGIRQGRTARQIAVDVAGRVNPATGKREGGIIGLTDLQKQYVDNFRARLLSGDPAEMKKVIGSFKDGKWVAGTGSTLRDKRFDRIIIKAIREDRGLTEAEVSKMQEAYVRRLIKRRAEDIAQTEVRQAGAMARRTAFHKALRKAGLPDEALTKTWHHTFQKQPRHMHVMMNGVTVRGLDTPFVMADGVFMQYDHDPNGGAKHNANCKCRTTYKIDLKYGES